MAFEARQQHEEAEAAQRLAEDKQERARTAGLAPLEAADLLAQGKAEGQEARTRAVKARARLNFALDRMDDAERGEWEAFQPAARAGRLGTPAETLRST